MEAVTTCHRRPTADEEEEEAVTWHQRRCCGLVDVAATVSRCGVVRTAAAAEDVMHVIVPTW